MSQKHQVRSSLLDAIQAPDPERGKSLYVEEAGDEASGSLAWPPLPFKHMFFNRVA